MTHHQRAEQNARKLEHRQSDTQQRLVHVWINASQENPKRRHLKQKSTTVQTHKLHETYHRVIDTQGYDTEQQGQIRPR